MDVSYYPGCSLSGTARDYGESVEAVSGTLGVALKELPDWNCCGSSSAHVTNDELSVALAARNLEIADKIGKDVAVPCAMCYSRLKVAEKALLAGREIEGISHKYEGSIHVKHLVDFFWENVGEQAILEKVKKPLEGLNPVCYYGCLITRPPEITDAVNPEDPQSMDNILKTLGANVKNWSYKTDCCGGSLILTLPEIAHKLIQKLLDMSQEAGADCIVAACPMCHSNLDGWQKEISQETGRKYDIPIFYFTELMGLAFGDASVKKWLHRHGTDPIPFLHEKELL
ncbi:MAG: CoB--CoM heterodisulfide reductase iron-sulfur subunit B family protein [Chloroflexi bacterium]|nr:CoB--CoM heterodisulfide reductase iron-sulfur subunit B family protein [Chloroflexota bacterium]